MTSDMRDVINAVEDAAEDPAGLETKVTEVTEDLARSLRQVIEVARTGYTSLPEVLGGVLEDLAVEHGTVDALTRNCPLPADAELVAELAEHAQARIDAQLLNEAYGLGHRLDPVGDNPVSWRCTCGWDAREKTEGRMHHIVQVVEDHWTAAGAERGHHITRPTPDAIACSCGWNETGDEPAIIVTHLRSAGSGT